MLVIDSDKLVMFFDGFSNSVVSVQTCVLFHAGSLIGLGKNVRRGFVETREMESFGKHGLEELLLKTA